MNNKKGTSKLASFFGISCMIVLGLIVYSLFPQTEMDPIIKIALWLLLAILLVVFGYGGYYYIEIASTKGNLQIRYFNLFPVGRKYKALQMPLERYSHYEIKKPLGVLFSFLYIYENTARGLARYQPIGLSALKREEKENLKNILDQIKK